MKARAVLVLVVAAAACTGGGATERTDTTSSSTTTTVQQTTTTMTDPRPYWERVGQEALAAYEALDPNWQRTGFTIVFHPDDSASSASRADLAAARIDIYISPRDTVPTTTGLLAHEVGHAIDWLYLTDDERDQWKAARGITADGWWSYTPVHSDFDLPSGDWAESWAKCLIPTHRFQGQLTNAPIPTECALAQQLAAT